MKKFSIPVFWSLAGNVVVEAADLTEAIKLAEEADLPNVSEYIHDSFVVNVDEMADHDSDYYVID